MFGRAGRRGLDETGFILITANELRLLDARPGHLSRGGLVDWNALLGLMDAAAEQGRDPFQQAVRIQERLFTTKPIALGVEESLRHPDAPCGLKTDSERARHIRQRVRQMLNSAGQWENYPAHSDRPAKEVRIMESAETFKTHSALSDSAALEKLSGGPAMFIAGGRTREDLREVLDGGRHFE